MIVGSSDGWEPREMKTLCEKPRLRRLLDHFSAVTDPREQGGGLPLA